MTARRWVSAALFLVAAGIAPARAEPPDLEEILRRLSRTADLFRDAALEFTCRETISWNEVDRDPGIEAFEYVFVREPGRGYEDYRTIPTPGRRRRAPDEIDLIARRGGQNSQLCMPP